jgi:diacylglycerol kinase (ATP)
MKTRLIINPVSGTDSGPDYLEAINKRLRTYYDEMDIVMTVAAGDAIYMAERTALDGYERIFIAGGDGTLNEVLNGVGRVEDALSNITFGLLPLGTGNDFAEALGIPTDLDKAMDILCDDHIVKVDLGMLNDRYFINVSAGGFIAEVSDAVSPQLKTIAGKLAYLIGGAQVIFDYEPVHVEVKAIDDNQLPIDYSLDIEIFAVCNSRLIGGGRLIAPEAIIDDGLFDICLIEDMPTLEFIGLLTRVSNGDYINDERVRYFRAEELDIKFNRTIKVNTDGEVLETDLCKYRLLTKHVQFLAGNAPYTKSIHRKSLDSKK